MGTVETWISGAAADLPDPELADSLEEIARMKRVAYAIARFYETSENARFARLAGHIARAQAYMETAERMRAELISWGFSGLA